MPVRANQRAKEGDPVRSGVPLPRCFGCIRLAPTNRTVRRPEHNPALLLSEQQNPIAELATGMRSCAIGRRDIAHGVHLVRYGGHACVALDVSATPARYEIGQQHLHFADVLTGLQSIDLAERAQRLRASRTCSSVERVVTVKTLPRVAASVSCMSTPMYT